MRNILIAAFVFASCHTNTRLPLPEAEYRKPLAPPDTIRIAEKDRSLIGSFDPGTLTVDHINGQSFFVYVTDSGKVTVRRVGLPEWNFDTAQLLPVKVFRGLSYNFINNRLWFNQPGKFLSFGLDKQPGQWLQQDSILLNNKVDLKKWYYMNQFANRFTINGQQPALVINYGEPGSKGVNYLGEHIFLLQTTAGKAFAGDYPKELTKHYVVDREAKYGTDSTGNIFYLFANIDTLYKMAMDGTLTGKTALSNATAFPVYGKHDYSDLAYLRKFKAITPFNLSLTVFRQRYIIIVRKLAHASVMDKPRYKYFVYDKDLQLQFTDTIVSRVDPKIIPTPTGFGFLNDSLNTFYHYALK